MSIVKIMMEAGHGIGTPGKRSPDGRLREYAYCRRVVNEAVRRLRALGYDAQNMVPEDADIPLGERASRVNAVCDRVGASRCLLVSVHLNAAGNGSQWMSATGWECWTTKGKTVSDELAECMYDAAEKVLGGLFAPGRLKIRTDMTDGDRDKEENWTILYRAKCAAVLTENFFMDNRADAEWLESEAGFDAIVRLHVEGVLAYVKRRG